MHDIRKELKSIEPVNDARAPVTLVCPFTPSDYQMPEVRKALAEK
jgi:hypothetical protein